MKKILIEVTNWTLHYDGKEYKSGSTLEIEERFFRDDCMKKIEKVIQENEEVENTQHENEDLPKEGSLITVKELKEISQTKEVTLAKTKKDEIFKEAKEKFTEKGLDLEEEIKKYLALKNAEVVENENSEATD